MGKDQVKRSIKTALLILLAILWGVGFFAVKKHYGWVTGTWDYTFAKLINLGLFGVVAVLIVKIIKTKD